MGRSTAGEDLRLWAGVVDARGSGRIQRVETHADCGIDRMVAPRVQ